jgi:hypothetical protein
MIPVFHPAAEQELSAAMKIGEERGTGLGRELLIEVRRIVALLCDNPQYPRTLGSAASTFSPPSFSVWPHLSQ